MSFLDVEQISSATFQELLGKYRCWLNHTPFLRTQIYHKSKSKLGSLS
jgi:hypothetical protein